MSSKEVRFAAIVHVCEVFSALVVDDNVNEFSLIGKDVFEVTIPWKDSDNKSHDRGVAFEGLKDRLVQKKKAFKCLTQGKKTVL